MLFPGLDNSATGLSVATMEQPASHPSALHNLDESDDEDTQQPDDSHEKNEVSAMQEEDDLSDDEDWIEEDLGEKSETLGALLEDFGGNVSSMVRGTVIYFLNTDVDF